MLKSQGSEALAETMVFGVENLCDTGSAGNDGNNGFCDQWH